MKKLLPVLSAAALSACAVLSQEPVWRAFQDLDGKVREVSFFERINAMEYQKPLEERDYKNHFQGFAVQREQGSIGLGDDLGAYTLLFNGHGIGMVVIFRSGGQSFNPYKAEDAEKLARVREFDFYEFGAQRLSHVKFSAEKGICRDFARQGVKVEIATNYYPQNSYTDYYTAHVRADLSAGKEARNFAYHAVFAGNKTDLQREIREVDQTRGKDLAWSNMREKATILENIVCKTNN